MIKRKAAYALVGGLLVAGLMFNAPTMATYVQKFNATQTINAATWSIDFGHNLGTHTIFPEGEVSNDTITLKNGNSYPVKYTIDLTNEGDAEFNDVLSLTLTDGTKSYIEKSGIGEVIVGANETITLKSIVKWNATGNDTIHAGKQVKYNYEIVAEKAKNDEENPEQPEIENDIIVENPQSGVQVITVNSQAAIDKVVADIKNENPDAEIEEVKEEGDYYVYTIRVPKATSTFAMDTTNYDYIIVKVPKYLNDGTGLGDIERVPALTRAWAYRNNASDTSVHVTIQTAADLDLSTGSNDNIQIHYYKEDATSKVASRSKLNDGYLNKNSVKYPQGLVNKSDYSNDAKAGEYTSTLKKTFIEPADQVKYIQVIVTKDGRTYDSGLQEVQVRDR